MNILITSAGRRVSLLKSFQKEVANLQITSKVFAADANPELSAACRISDGFFLLPKISQKDYIEKLLSLCEYNSISLVIPTIDTELLILAENRQLFKTKGIEMLVSDFQLIEKCRDKRLIHKLFEEFKVKAASEYDSDNLKFPLFVKPYDGSSSINTHKIDCFEQITPEISANKKLMYLEYIDPLKHAEFTVDMYYDKNSDLKCFVPRERIEVRSGEINKGITRKNFLNSYLSERFKVLPGARGCITLQLFVGKTEEAVIGIEINPRFGGGFPLSYCAGANFPNWIIREYLMGEIIEEFNDWKENLLMLRYDDEILVHDYKG